MIIGHYTSNISGSNRVAIPKKFRLELGEDFIVAKWYEECLVIVSKNNWEELLGKLTGNSPIVTGSVRSTDRFILGSAFEISPDAQGRVVLPKPLAKYAGLKEDVMFVGLGNRVEIWDKAKWEAQEDYLAQNASELLENINNE